MNIVTQGIERLILESRNKFRTLIDGIDYVIYSINADFIITSANKTAADSLGLHPREVVGRPCRELFCPLNRQPGRNDFICPALAALRTGRNEISQLTVAGQDRVTCLEIKAMPLPLDINGRQGAILVHRDITAQKTAEQQIMEYNRRLAEQVRERTVELEKANDILTLQKTRLEQANQELKDLETVKQDLTNMVIHDLKGPLAEIIGNLAILEGEPLTGNQLEVLKTARMGSDEMFRLIGNLLDISRMEEKKLKLNLAVLDPGPIIHGLARRYQPLADLKSITIQAHLPENSPLIRADRGLFERIIINLLTNAIDHGREQGLIVMEIEPELDRVIFRVRDNGRGIPPQILSHIFEKFSQGGNGGPKTGSGLGLTFCKMAVEAHGGSIRVESELDRGATFSVFLPFDETPTIPTDRV